MKIMITTIILLACTTSVFAAPLELASNGKTAYTIVIAPDATAAENNAAQELSSFLQQVTGAKFAIAQVTANLPQPVIAVGPGAAKAVSSSLNLDKSELGNDGIVLRTEGANIILTGAIGSQRGSLYAVYNFLEEVAGIRWWTPWESTIPSKPKLTCPELNTRYVPPIIYRDILHYDMQGNREYWDGKSPLDMDRVKFAVRHRVNGHASHVPEQWGGHMSLIGWCHTSDMLMPPAEYFDAHPEWYSEINGKRQKDWTQLCWTNEEMLAELTKNALTAIEKDPNAGIISISQNDWTNNCQCEKCRAIDEAEGSPSGSLLYGVNKVAEGIAKKYPDFLVETLAYWYTRKPPKTLKPLDNVLIRYCVIERWTAQPIDSEQNKRMKDDLEIWSKIAPNLFIWDYIDNMFTLFMPHPNAHTIGADAQLYLKNHAVGLFYEGDDASVSVGEDDVRAWLMGRAAWNPQIDNEAEINKFLTGYYGPAAGKLRETMRIMQGEAEKVRIGGNGDGSTSASWISLKALNRMTELFDEAEALVSHDNTLLRRVQRMRLPIDHQWLRRYAQYKIEANQSKQPFNGPTDLLESVESFITLANSYNVDVTNWAGAPKTFDVYTNEMRAEAKKVATTLLPALEKSMASPASLPVEFTGLPADKVVDIQECFFNYPAPEQDAAVIVPDAKASNGFAAWINPDVITWPVQIRNLENRELTGRWHVYASVRFEVNKPEGMGFIGGIWDEAGQGSPRFSLNVPASESRNGAYILYDMGVHDLTNATYAWLGNNGVERSTIIGTWVDRFIFVKE